MKTTVKKKIIAVLITVHNRKDKTLACLRRIYSQQLPETVTVEVYVTDDGCTDGTTEAILIHFPQTNIIQGDGNLFWNRGMYEAWSAAEKKDYDYYLWLNDDTILFENAISLLLSVSEIKSNESIIVGYTIDSKRKRITYGGRNKYTGLITNVKSITECDTFNGNIVLIPRRVYKMVGKNDPVFHHAIGDTDYGLRAQKMGIKSYISDVACGICDSHAKLPKWSDKSIPLHKRIQFLYRPGGNGANPIEFFIYKKRHYGLFAAIMTFISNHIHLLFPFLWNKDASKY